MRLSVRGSLAFSGLFLSQVALGQAITEFSVPFSPRNIVSGPDGNLWFTTEGPALMRMTTSGVVTQVSKVDAFDLVFDSDGNLWLTEDYKIGRLAPDGKITEFVPLGNGLSPLGDIAFGADGNIWFTMLFPTAIGRITSSGSISEFPLPGTPGQITAGPDGNLWFIEFANGMSGIGRITLSGIITEFPIPGTNYPLSITAGGDGALWFTDNTGKIGRITTSGVVSEFDIPGYEGQGLRGITSGPDGAIWFTESSEMDLSHSPVIPLFPSKIGRITRDGAVSEVLLPTSFPYPGAIRTGPDGNLWVTEPFGIARILPTAANCADDVNTLCLVAGRFRASVTWQSPTASGIGTSNPLTSNTGAFWFFDPTNLELVVKVLDGRSINGKFWVFYGSLTNVEFTLTVTDTVTGAVKTYINPQGQLASVADTSAF